MTTKFNLEFPYNEKWKFGYLVTNKENRKTVILFNSRHDRSSTQYARYLLAVKLKRFLSEEETVDHIDNDKTNDELDNLQILSKGDNIRKQSKKPNVEIICPVCKVIFYRSLTQLRVRKDKLKENRVSCSRKCGGILSHMSN